MFTIFTTPKPFLGHIKTIQDNAIQSWKRLSPDSEVILLGNEDGTEKAAKKYGCKYVPDVERNEYGTPYIRSLFYEAEKISKNKIMCFANCDIMFNGSMLDIVEIIKKKDKFLLIGQRCNVDINIPWDFTDSEWGDKLYEYANINGKLNHRRGIDYFIYNSGTFLNIPDLVVGRAWWDNWMIYEAKKNHVPVIDGTKMLLAVHQNHDYLHCEGGQKAAYLDGPEVLKNISFVDNGKILMTIDDAEWVAENGKIRFAFGRLYRHLIQLPLLLPWLKTPVMFAKAILKPIKSIPAIKRAYEKLFQADL